MSAAEVGESRWGFGLAAVGFLSVRDALAAVVPFEWASERGGLGGEAVGDGTAAGF